MLSENEGDAVWTGLGAREELKGKGSGGSWDKLVSELSQDSTRLIRPRLGLGAVELTGNM